MNTTATTETPATSHTSLELTPSTLPNSSESALRPGRPVPRDERDTERERCGRHHADRRIGADRAPTHDAPDRQRRDDAPDAGAEEQVDADQTRDGVAAEDRMRQAVADVAHVAQHDVAPDQAAQGAGHRRDVDTVAEELECVRCGQLGPTHQPTPRSKGSTLAFGPASTTTRIPPCSRICIGDP